MKFRIINQILLLLVLVFSGCHIKRDAIGTDNKIIVIVPRPQVEAVKSALSTIFNDTLYTPQPEPEYLLQFATINEFQRYNTHVNIIVVGLGQDQANPGNQLVKQMLPASSYKASKDGGPAVFLTHDQYAQDQLFMILSARDKEHLIDELAKRSAWIKKKFDDLFDLRQRVYLFERVCQEDIENKLFADYGWAIKVPWGYEVVKDAPDSNFFWMGRQRPFRWLSVQWETSLTVNDADDAITKLHSYAAEFYGHIQFTDYHLKIEQVDFKNWTAWRITGMWEKIEEAQGGPFLHYIFYDGVSDRTYQINMTVFFPGKGKMILLRQLDILAHSLYVEQESEEN